MANTPVVVLDDTMTSIANAIRSKTGGSATMTPGQMPAQIASIPSGGSFVGIPKSVNEQGVYGPVTEETVFSLPEGAKDVDTYTFWYAFYGSTGIKKFDAHTVEKISYGYAFARCCQSASNLEEIDFSNLEQIHMNASYAFQNAFAKCEKLAEVSFPKLTLIGNQNTFDYAFSHCSNLTKAEFPLLQTVNGATAFSNTFLDCSNLTTVNFNSLSTVTGSSAFALAFRNCTSLRELNFPSLSSVGSATNQFNNMLSGVTGCTVHFPSSMQATIGSWASVTSGFGGTNTTVLFDL